MNETLKVLETRRSCRNFKSDMVEQDKIAERTVKNAAAPRKENYVYYVK